MDKAKRLERWYRGKREKNMKKYFTPRIQEKLKKTEDNPDECFEVTEYIFGKVNTGKTINACQKLLNTVLNDYLQGTPRTYCFIELSEMLHEIKSVYSTDHSSDWDVIEKYSKYDILIIDDFMSQKITPWVYQTLYTIINRRYEYLKITIYTSNIGIEELIKQLQDERIPRRIESQIYDNS